MRRGSSHRGRKYNEGLGVGFGCMCRSLTDKGAALARRPGWIVLAALAAQPSFTLPFIYSPSRGSGCLGRLLWPWGAWLSLWSLLPGTDYPPTHLDPDLCSPAPPGSLSTALPDRAASSGSGEQGLRVTLPIKQEGGLEALKGGYGVQPRGRGPVPPDPVAPLPQPCPLGSGLGWGSLSFPLSRPGGSTTIPSCPTAPLSRLPHPE